MKKTALVLLLFATISISFYSCKNEESKSETDKNKNLITERIQYDVFIKSPYENDVEWWKENIDGAKRESFIKKIMASAFDGKVQAYTYNENEPVSGEELEKLLNPTDTIQIISPLPPYDIYDTIVQEKLNFNNITKIRFMEEWYMNEKTLEITKKVVGICPVIPSYDIEGEFRGNKPLFWIYLDDKYPIK